MSTEWAILVYHMTRNQSGRDGGSLKGPYSSDAEAFKRATKLVVEEGKFDAAEIIPLGTKTMEVFSDGDGSGGDDAGEGQDADRVGNDADGAEGGQDKDADADSAGEQDGTVGE